MFKQAELESYTASQVVQDLNNFGENERFRATNRGIYSYNVSIYPATEDRRILGLEEPPCVSLSEQVILGLACVANLQRHFGACDYRKESSCDPDYLKTYHQKRTVHYDRRRAEELSYRTIAASTKC